MKCPECDFDNPADSKFCKECGTQLVPPKDVPVSFTETMEAPREELTTGSTFATRYQIIEELGRGGMGKVYKAIDKEINAKIALKLIKPEIASDKKTIERFRNELKMARDIAHKNICRMYDLGKEEGSYYITMEFVDGEDLKSMLRMSGQMSAGSMINTAKQVCEGLIEAHRLGVVHRDLKPQNIMIDKEGNARIMDFGIASSPRAKGLTGAGVMIGTPEYMSPEQVEGKDVDQRSDIYSLGVILYEMATGEVPFEGDTPYTIGVKHKSEIPQNPREINPQISEDLGRVIMKCLEKDKENRYQSAGELRSELHAIEEGIPTSQRVAPAKKPLTSREITVKFSMKKLFIPALAVLAVVVAGLLIWQLLLRKEAPPPLPTDRRSVAVISFENHTGDKAYDYLQKAIPNLLITNLESSGYLEVTTWERMRDLLKQIDKKDVEIIDRDLGFELCRMEGVDAIVLGSFIKAGEMFATDVKVLDVQTKALLKSASSKGRGVDSILETQIDELSRDISSGVGIAAKKIEEAALKVTDVTTSSMEAYSYFLKGRDLSDRFYFPDARQNLEKAVALDPTFASAYLYLAWACWRLGDEKAMTEAFERARLFSDRATEKEKLHIEGSYLWWAKNNVNEAIELLKEAVKKYPKEKQLRMTLAYAYGFSNMFKEAIEEYNRVLELDPSSGLTLNQLAYAHGSIGEYETAIKYLKKYATVSPGDANPLDSTGEMYFWMGRLDEAIAKYKEVIEIKPDFGVEGKIGYIYALKEEYDEALEWNDAFLAKFPQPGWKSRGLMDRGFYFHLLGSLDQSLRILQSAEEEADKVGDEPLKAILDYFRGWIYYDRGEHDLCQQHFERAFDYLRDWEKQNVLGSEAGLHFCLGLLAIQRGNLKEANTRLDELNGLLPQMIPYENRIHAFSYGLLKGEILLAEGKVEQAIASLEKASSLGAPPTFLPEWILPYNYPFQKDTLARAYQKKGELRRAIAEYEKLITFDPKREERTLIHPLYNYRVARLYEEKGWKGKATDQYSKFLEIWKNADSTHPELSDAKERLAALQSQ